MAAMRADYFLAGTVVVWDVDPVAREVNAYLSADPSRPRVYRGTDAADAEPAVRGWRLVVSDQFA